MDVKFGKIKPNSKSNFTCSLLNESGENFFVSSLNNDCKEDKPVQVQNGIRINDYDSKILEDNAYQEMTDEIFKIEHKMGVLEGSLSKINDEIITLEGLGYDIQVHELRGRKQKIEQELLQLNEKYSNLCLSTKISGKISSVIGFTSGNKGNFLENIKKNLSKKILAKVSRKVNYAQKMRDALESLSKINSSIDELIQMQVPYGETSDRYQKLTACLNKANSIQAQIIKNTNIELKKES